MAIRKRNWVDPKTREKIKTTQILNRLQNFALGKDEPGCPGKKTEMTPAQVKAAQILLNKNLPDLSSSEISLTSELPENKAEIFERLKKVLGEDLALQLAPEFREDLPVNKTLQ